MLDRRRRAFNPFNTEAADRKITERDSYSGDGQSNCEEQTGIATQELCNCNWAWVRRQHNMDRKEGCRDRKPDAERVDLGYGCEAKNDRRKNNETDIKEHRNTQDECGDYKRHDDTFAAELASEVLSESRSASGLLDDLAEHRAETDHYGN